MIEKVLRFSLHHPFVILLLTLVIGAYGTYALFHLPIDAVPDITNNQVQINAELPGYSPLQIEKQVTYVIETALAGIPGLQTTRSLSRNGFSQVTAIFDDEVNIYFARQQITERLNEAKETLPQGTELHLGPISTGLGEIYMWTVDFKKIPEHLSEAERYSYLRMVQDWIIKPQLKSVPGLADVDSIGGYTRQYHIEPHLDRLLALGLTLDHLQEALIKNNQSIGPGVVEKNGEAFLVKSDERLEAIQQIESVVIATQNGIPITIRDVAEVQIGKELRTGSATKNGHEVVVGTALMLIGSNSRTVAQAVDRKLKEISASLPTNIEVTPVLNRTKLVNATINTVQKNLIEGALLVILVLFVFLGNIRAALITACVIPLAMIMAAIGMSYFKISGNLMSLGALDFGLIVDGAVIITENCLRHLASKGNLNPEERLREILVASKEMIQPTVFGQCIILTVYFPILALTGVEGKMFHPMAMTVILALISAFILSLTFVPAMIALLIKGPLKEKENFIMSFFKNLYRPILKGVLKWPNVATSAAMTLMAFSFILFFQLGEEFVPRLDEQDIAMHSMRIPSTSLNQSTQMQMDVERALLQFPEVDYVFSKTGTAEMASDPMPPNVSDAFIFLKPRDTWPNPTLPKNELIEKIETALKMIPGNNYEFTQPIEMRFNELISGVRSDVAIKIYGDDFSKMEKAAQNIAHQLQNIPGASDIKVDQVSGLPALDVKINREVASYLGLNVSDILDVISVAIGGGHAGQIFEGDRRFDLVVKLPEGFRHDINAIGQLPIPLAQKGQTIPLNEVATLRLTEGLNEIKRENGKRFVSIQSNVRGSDLGSFVEEAKTKIAVKTKLPEGYWLDWGGQFEHLISARQRLMLVIPLCFALIFGLLYTAFQSIRYAMIVFTGVPLALSGGIAALWLRDMPFSITSAVGFIALSGVAVLNGLVLISSINHLRTAGNSLEDSIFNGSLSRLRPVLMTAFVASLGFVPMALATGTGAEVQKPLATVVIGGLISSTFLTLLFLPALYFIFGGQASKDTGSSSDEDLQKNVKVIIR